jgi:hypothetical protein
MFIALAPGFMGCRYSNKGLIQQKIQVKNSFGLQAISQSWKDLYYLQLCKVDSGDQKFGRYPPFEKH